MTDFITPKEAIENLLIKERLDLSPHLRELDEQVEATELTLRAVVLNALEVNGAQPPSHIMQKVDERIARASKKDASFDGDFYTTMQGKLEYFDLRELQDVIVNGALWPHFESRFRNKQTLATKFDQLAELRNSIRHSRALGEIVRKEGEAALLWFDQVLKA